MDRVLQVNRLVTVYITTYNRLSLLERAVNSVLNQTYSPIEIIVADDGSTDGTHEYLAAMEARGRLKSTINRSGVSKGACYGRNNAISMAQGYFITGLDDDDYFESFRIMEFIRAWQELESVGNNISGLFDGVVELRNDGRFHYNETTIVNYKMLRESNFIGNQVFTTREKLLDVGSFDVNMPALQDWETWIRLSKKHGDFINISKFSYIVDQTHGGERISEKKAKKIRLAFYKLAEKNAPLSFRERVSHLESLYAYKQVDIVGTEVLTLLFAGKVRKFMQVVKRFIKNAK